MGKGSSRILPTETWPGMIGIRHAGEPAVVDVDVGAAHFRVDDVEERGTRLEVRRGDLLQPHRLVRPGHDGRGEALRSRHGRNQVALIHRNTSRHVTRFPCISRPVR